jgi:hypothetical protein
MTFGGGRWDAFVAKLDPGVPGVGGLIYCSYLGGNGDDEVARGFLDQDGNLYLAGQSSSDNFLVTAGNYTIDYTNGSLNGILDGYIAKIIPDEAPVAGVSVVKVVFPDQLGGYSSNPMPMLLGSYTSVPIDVTTIQVVDEYGGPNSDFCVDPRDCVKTFEVGERCTVDLYFIPDSVPPPACTTQESLSAVRRPSSIHAHPRTPPRLPMPRGTRSGFLSITSSLGISTDVGSVLLTGDVVYPLLSVSPTGLNFSATPLGEAGDAKAVTLTNVGATTLSLSNFAVAGGNSNDFHIANLGCGASLDVDAGCTINVSFAPTAVGPRKSALVITDNAPESPHRVVLTGIGSALSVSPPTLTFPDRQLGSTGPLLPITLANLGSGPVHVWGSAITGTNSGDFSLVNACPVPPATLGGGANCAISVQFTPAGIGARTASLMISHDGGASPSAVTLAGTGAAAAVSPPPRSGSWRTATPRSTEGSTSGRGSTNGQSSRRLRPTIRGRH